ncbi:hypothetical protein [Leisingera sp. ANG59]|uniref:hypothetical protein n=1 Tax=Leisingera sp. ANG59 TaxID=2675221 RepID=UPI001574BC34|nr:hypothetical protein [Leisingera sp. ANG59]NSY40768.1 hypothetical protein [Leisingera sp. ANG59]
MSDPPFRLAGLSSASATMGKCCSRHLDLNHFAGCWFENDKYSKSETDAPQAVQDRQAADSESCNAPAGGLPRSFHLHRDLYLFSLGRCRAFLGAGPSAPPQSNAPCGHTTDSRAAGCSGIPGLPLNSPGRGCKTQKNSPEPEPCAMPPRAKSFSNFRD